MTEVHEAYRGYRTDDFVQPEAVLPLWENIWLGMQHVLAMFGSTVLGPVLMGFDPGVALFFSGISTIMFYVILKGRIPSYLGSSFSFIAAVSAATAYNHVGANKNIPYALGGIMAAGALYLIFALIVRQLGSGLVRRILPPVVTGAIVAIIGLNLAGVAVKEISSSPFDSFFGLLVIVIVAVVNVYTPRRLGRFAILIGSVVSYALYIVLANVAGFGKPISFIDVVNSPLIGTPGFTLPRFDVTSIALIAPVAVILVAENLGHVRAIGSMCHRDLDPFLWRAFAADSLATMISAAFGGTGVTTYAENIGVMTVSRNLSSLTMVFAGGVAVVLGFSPMFSAVIQTIPLPILGGLSFILFGLIVAAAGRIWRDEGVDFSDSSNSLVVGVSVIMGAGDFTLKAGPYVFGGITTATFTAIALHYVLRGRRFNTIEMGTLKS